MIKDNVVYIVVARNGKEVRMLGQFLKSALRVGADIVSYREDK